MKTSDRIKQLSNRYIGVFTSRSDGDYDLKHVIAPISLDDITLPEALLALRPIIGDNEDGILVALEECNFPDVWDGSPADPYTLVWAYMDKGEVQIGRDGDVPTNYCISKGVAASMRCLCGSNVPLECVGGQYQNHSSGECPSCGNKWELIKHEDEDEDED